MAACSQFRLVCSLVRLHDVKGYLLKQLAGPKAGRHANPKNAGRLTSHPPSGKQRVKRQFLDSLRSDVGTVPQLCRAKEAAALTF